MKQCLVFVKERPSKRKKLWLLRDPMQSKFLSCSNCSPAWMSPSDGFLWWGHSGTQDPPLLWLYLCMRRDTTSKPLQQGGDVNHFHIHCINKHSILCPHLNARDSGKYPLCPRAKEMSFSETHGSLCHSPAFWSPDTHFLLPPHSPLSQGNNSKSHPVRLHLAQSQGSLSDM